MPRVFMVFILIVSFRRLRDETHSHIVFEMSKKTYSEDPYVLNSLAEEKLLAKLERKLSDSVICHFFLRNVDNLPMHNFDKPSYSTEFTCQIVSLLS